MTDRLLAVYLTPWWAATALTAWCVGRMLYGVEETR